MFIKGMKHTKEAQQKGKQKRLNNNGNRKCIICGVEFQIYSVNQITCGSKECKQKNNVRNYYDNSDPIIYKAKRISGSIRLGKGKNDKIVKLLKDNVGKPCKYCNNIITLEDASLDHIEPRKNSKVRKGGYTKEELKHLDRIENLQIICTKCNRLKCDFNDVEFRKLLKFMDENKDVKIKLLTYLRRGHLCIGKGYKK